jgi:DNA-binding protein HU-beta
LGHHACSVQATSLADENWTAGVDRFVAAKIEFGKTWDDRIVGVAAVGDCVPSRYIIITEMIRRGEMAKLMSKSELIQKIVEQHPNGMTRKDVKGVIEAVAEIGYKELKKTGAFFVPGFAKFVVIKKPATKARKGINPFTKEPTIFKAKPARKIIRARPVKAAKDAVA